MDASDQKSGSATHGMTTEEADAWNKEMSDLKWLNKVCAMWHFFQGALMFTLSFVNEDLKNFVIPVTTLFTDWTNDYPEQ